MLYRLYQQTIDQNLFKVLEHVSPYQLVAKYALLPETGVGKTQNYITIQHIWCFAFAPQVKNFIFGTFTVKVMIGAVDIFNIPCQAY